MIIGLGTFTKEYNVFKDSESRRIDSELLKTPEGFITCGPRVITLYELKNFGTPYQSKVGANFASMDHREEDYKFDLSYGTDDTSYVGEHILQVYATL